MKMIERERRDLGLFVLILPIGILLMFGAGQIAMRLLPIQDISANMGSQMDPNKQYAALKNGEEIEPVLPGILTPAAWRDTFLTPQAGQGNGEAVPLVVFVPSSTPSPVVTATTVAMTEISPTVVTTSTSVPTIEATTTTAATSIAPTTVWTPPPATKTKKPKPDDPGITATAVPSNTPAPVPSIPFGTQVAAPAEINVNAPPDGTFATIADGNYIVVDLGSDSIKWVHVTTPADTAPDLVYYERITNPTQIAMDGVIVGISHNPDGNANYIVFNWGDGTPDKNTNLDTTKLVPPAVPAPVGPVPAAEDDNQLIPTTVLSQDPSAPSSPQTGIAIDVDNAPSHPPTGDYQYVVIQAPPNPPSDGNDGAEVDAVQATDVPTP